MVFSLIWKLYCWAEHIIFYTTKIFLTENDWVCKKSRVEAHSSINNQKIVQNKKDYTFFSHRIKEDIPARLQNSNQTQQ